MTPTQAEIAAAHRERVRKANQPRNTKILIGECTGRLADEALARGWGRMWVARSRNIYTAPGEPWGLDNGAFADWKNGLPFDEGAFLRAVEKARQQPERPLLAVVPDLVGKGERSLRFSVEWRERLPDDLPWYLAVQDRMTVGMVKPYLDGRFAGLFLGGTDAFKPSAVVWCGLAHRYGLRFHYGRASTRDRILNAFRIGADSLDSTQGMWSRKLWRQFLDRIEYARTQLEWPI